MRNGLDFCSELLCRLWLGQKLCPQRNVDVLVCGLWYEVGGDVDTLLCRLISESWIVGDCEFCETVKPGLMFKEGIEMLHVWISEVRGDEKYGSRCVIVAEFQK